MNPRIHFFHAQRVARGALIAALLLAPALAVSQQDFGQQQPANPSPQNSEAYPPPQDPSGYPQQQEPPPSTYQGNPAYPQQGDPGLQAAPPSGYGQSAPAAPLMGVQGNPLQQLVQSEMQDYGIAPQTQLQQNLHGPTPTSIPGGKVITTDRLLGQIQQGQQGGLLIFHVLGQGEMIPGAQFATPASQPGTFNDQTQQEFGQYLGQVTQGRKDRPMVFYCLNTQCWMSYNASLRAINMGYTNVLWYRGGIESWKRAEQIAASVTPQRGMQPAQGQSPGYQQQ